VIHSYEWRSSRNEALTRCAESARVTMSLALLRLFLKLAQSRFYIHRLFKSTSIYFAELTFWLSNVGLNWLLYKSNHLAAFTKEKGLLYSLFLSSIFSFGSTMMVNHISHFFGRVELLRLISSVTLSSCLLSIGYTYLDDLNQTNQSDSC
jgi:hypothetical protein